MKYTQNNSEYIIIVSNKMIWKFIDLFTLQPTK